MPSMRRGAPRRQDGGPLHAPLRALHRQPQLGRLLWMGWLLGAAEVPEPQEPRRLTAPPAHKRPLPVLPPGLAVGQRQVHAYRSGLLIPARGSWLGEVDHEDPEEGREVQVVPAICGSETAAAVYIQ